MNFNLVSKNNVGGVILLLLIIILSQARTFNFLIDTALGRSFLILFILFLSYSNKILGVVGVLFIIIMFNHSSFMYLEGFDSTINSSGSSNNNNSTNLDASNNIISNNNSSSNNMPSNNNNSSSNNNNNSSSNNNNNSNSNNSDQMKKQIQNSSNSDSDSGSSNINVTTNSGASEGFDILGTENNIKRGKQSNSISVNSFMRESNYVQPYEGSSIKETFSSF